MEYQFAGLMDEILSLNFSRFRPVILDGFRGYYLVRTGDNPLVFYAVPSPSLTAVHGNMELCLVDSKTMRDDFHTYMTYLFQKFYFMSGYEKDFSLERELNKYFSPEALDKARQFFKSVDVRI